MKYLLVAATLAGAVSAGAGLATPAPASDRDGSAARLDAAPGQRNAPAGEEKKADGPAEVPRHDLHEVVLTSTRSYANPFLDVAVAATVTAPSGKKRTVPGFHDGGTTWRVQLAPDEVGAWSYVTAATDPADKGLHDHTGSFRCVASDGKGAIRIHPQNPYAFAYADGTPFFPMGDTCYGLHTDSHITPELRRKYLDTRRAQRFNFVRFQILNSLKRAETNPAMWPWGGTPPKPDLDRLNPAFFQGLDELFGQLKARGMNAELIVLNFYRSFANPMIDTKQWTPERERLWLRYVVARYAAFSNLFLWTLANEYETHPDGQYRLDVPGDPEWAKATARLVKSLDPYRHPVTVHPVVSSSTKGTKPKEPFEPPWRIGGFFGEGDALDVLSQQTSLAYPMKWDEALHCWTGDAAGKERSIAADRKYKKPVLNTENGYEYLRDYPTYKRQVHHTDMVRRASWRIVCAGGYFAAGFAGTGGFGDAFERSDAPNRYPFLVKDMGAAGQLAALYDFFTALPFARLQPFDGVTGDAVALAEPGKVYVAYLPAGGAVTLDLTAAPGPLTARWFDPRAGKLGEPFPVRAGGRQEFRAPDHEDWTLLLR